MGWLLKIKGAGEEMHKIYDHNSSGALNRYVLLDTLHQ
jgi:hypothetical protein